MRLFTKDRQFYKAFFTLASTIALQNVISFGVNLADNIMLGAYNETSLSGVALVNQVQFLLQMVTAGSGNGLIIVASWYWGKKETGSIGKMSNIVMRLSVSFSVLLWAAAFFFPHALLSLLTNEAAVIAEGVRYIRIVCFSYVFFAMTTALVYTLRSVETVRIGFYMSLCTLLINICVNYILIYGHFGAPELGVRGAAIATLFSRIVEFAIMVSYVTFLDKKIALRLKTYLAPIDRGMLKSYLKTGMPVVFSHAFWGIAMGVQTAILGRLGAFVISANSIAATVFQIVSVFLYGSSSATAVLVAKTIGEGRLKEIKEYAVTLQFLYLAIGLLTGTVLFLSKGLILDFYKITEATRELAIRFMSILSVTVIGTAYQVASLSGIVSGAGQTRFSLYTDTLFMWLFVLPSAFLCAFVFRFSPAVVFFFLKSDQLLKCIVAVFKVNRFGWIPSSEKQLPVS